MDYDVVIAGAGPAGIATAVALVRQARMPPDRLLCLDRARFPRPKPCGGGLTGHAESALQALGLELRVPFVASPIGHLVYGQIRRTVRLPKPVRVVRRDELDADLVAQARVADILVREGEGVSSFAVDPTRRLVAVTTTAGTILRTRILVAADGAGSAIRRRLMDGHPGAPSQPLRLARLEVPAPAGFGDQMIYDFSPFAAGLRGYVWVFPVPGGRVNVGIMHYPASELGGRALDRLLAEALRRHGILLPGPARGWPAWPYHPGVPVSAPHVLCVGDAAGIDPLTGEGIAVGLEQGPIAARTVCEALATGDFRFVGYRAALRRALVGRELAVDRWLAALLYATADYRPWLGLVMCDERMLELYAARVSGSQVLADRKGTLLGALGRHLFLARERMQALARA